MSCFYKTNVLNGRELKPNFMTEKETSSIVNFLEDGKKKRPSFIGKPFT